MYFLVVSDSISDKCVPLPGNPVNTHHHLNWTQTRNNEDSCASTYCHHLTTIGNKILRRIPQWSTVGGI